MGRPGPWLPEELDTHDSHLSLAKAPAACMTPDPNLDLDLSLNHRPNLGELPGPGPHRPLWAKRQMWKSCGKALRARPCLL